MMQLIPEVNQATNQADYVHPEVLVDTLWLANHLNNDQVRIIEVEMDPEAHQNAHIPGAVFWHIFSDLLRPDLSQKLEGEAIAQLLSRSGITPETTVVAYGSYPGTGIWIFWLLKLFGHRDVRVLNGGYGKWIAEKRPVTAALSRVAPTIYPIPSSNPALRVLQSEVQAAIAQSDTILLDVRTLPEYRGEQYLMEPTKTGERAGHIPGAIHIEHLKALNDDGTFKSREMLQTIYAQQGITAEKQVFPYCAIGARSACTWFVLTYLLGYPHVRNYDGSWNEWSCLPQTPIVRPQAPEQN